MAHNIRINQFGKASFFSARIKAWHALGEVTEGVLSSEEAIKTANLDYRVGKKMVEFPVIQDGNIKYIKFDSKFVTYNTSDNIPFGIVGKNYEVIQNTEAFTFFDSIVGKGEAIYETAGALGNGETIFITAKLPDYIEVPGEEIEKYLLLTMAHDGTSSIKAGFTPVRVVCNNTLQWALQGGLGRQVSIRHTSDARRQLEEASKIMGITNLLSSELGSIFTKMKEKQVVEKEARDFFYRLFLDNEEKEMLVKDFNNNYQRMWSDNLLSGNKKNILDQLFIYHDSGIGQDKIKGTVFGLYNTVTGYYQNAKSSTTPKKLLESNINGYNARKMKESFTLAISMI